MGMVRIPDEIDKRLENLVNKAQRSKSFYIKKALEMSIQKLEDMYINNAPKFELEEGKTFYELLIQEFSNPVELVTEARKSSFTLFSEDGKLYVHNSKDNIHRLEENPANGFYEIFEETGNPSPNFYREVTFNASYFLAAIKYMEQKKSSTNLTRKPNMKYSQNYLNKPFTGTLDYDADHSLEMKEFIVRENEIAFSIELSWGDSGKWKLNGKAIKQGDSFISHTIFAVASSNPNTVDDGSILKIILKNFDEEFSILDVELRMQYHGSSHVFEGSLEYKN